MPYPVPPSLPPVVNVLPELRDPAPVTVAAPTPAPMPAIAPPSSPSEEFAVAPSASLAGNDSFEPASEVKSEAVWLGNPLEVDVEAADRSRSTAAWVDSSDTISTIPVSAIPELRGRQALRLEMAQPPDSTPERLENSENIENPAEAGDTTPDSLPNEAAPASDREDDGEDEILPIPTDAPEIENQTTPDDATPEAEDLPTVDPANPATGDVLVIPGTEQAPEAPDASPDAIPAPGEASPPSPNEETGTEAGEGSPATGDSPAVPVGTEDVLELYADRQEYDEFQGVFRAEGNVELRYRNATLLADRVQVNIPNRIAVAEGNAALNRGQQVLQGDRIEYNLVQNEGTVLNARGEIFLTSLSEDTAAQPVEATGVNSTQPLSERLEQQLQVLGSTGSVSFGVNTPNQIGAPAGTAGQIRRLRYEADQIEFMGQSWEATGVRITNDPFSPPELELRSNRVTVTPLSEFQTEIRARNPRLVFDQGLSIPLLRDRAVIDNRDRESGLAQFGYDERDRGGFFIERGFNVPLGPVALLRLTPQILVQRAFDEDGFLSPSSYGLIAQLDITPSLTSSIEGNAVLTSLDFGDENFDDTYRASARARQQIWNHTFALEYSYRDRLFNGSLGFQDVRSSLGLVVTSPRNIFLGDSGISLNYQAGVQLITSDANSTRLDDPDVEDYLPNINEFGVRPNNRIELARYQASAALNRSFLLWYDQPLPPTAEAGLRYTSNPVFPYVALSLGARGTVSGYSNGDVQSVVTGSVGLSGQFGNFSKPFLDYTAVSVSYSYNAVGGETPFDFDRVNDIQILSLGLTQQVYGPFRFGVNSTIYLESEANRENDADTTFFLEYSRRTYSINLSYSPQREAGAIGLRINDFNWTGTPSPFSPLEGETSNSEPGT